MKNTNKTSRRSFLKQSSLRVLVVANTSLFSGLLISDTKAAITLEPQNCVRNRVHTFSASGSNFFSEAAARQAALDAEENDLNWSHTDITWEYTYGSCPLFNPPQESKTPSNPEAVIWQENLLWHFTFSYQLYQTFC